MSAMVEARGVGLDGRAREVGVLPVLCACGSAMCSFVLAKGRMGSIGSGLRLLGRRVGGRGVVAAGLLAVLVALLAVWVSVRIGAPVGVLACPRVNEHGQFTPVGESLDGERLAHPVVIANLEDDA